MSRDPTWAATSVPEIRSRWCNALDALADRQTEIIESPPEGGATAGVTAMRFIGPRFLSSYYKKVYDGLGG
jgi:hypothetical protein